MVLSNEWYTLGDCPWNQKLGLTVGVKGLIRHLFSRQVQDALKETEDGKVKQDKLSDSSIGSDTENTGSDTEKLQREAKKEFSPICRSTIEENSGGENYSQNTEELQIPDSRTHSKRNVCSPSDTER